MLIVGSILLLLAAAVTLRREKSILFNRVAILILLYSGILGFDSLYIESIGTGIGVFSGLFHSTSITHSFDIFIYIIGAVILQLTSFYPTGRRLPEKTPRYPQTSGCSQANERAFEKSGNYNHSKHMFRSKLINKNEEQYLIMEYPLVILFILIGATFLMSSSDLVSMFIAIELQSYGLYILATLYRNSELATTAGLTYFLLGGLSSGFILLGSSLLYINSGLTNLDGFYVISSLCENKGVFLEGVQQLRQQTFIIDNGFIKTMNVNSQSFNLALLLVSVGYLFKVSAAPFHFWSPDVYDAIPTVVTTFVAILPKISIFIFLLELVHYTGQFTFEFNWTLLLLVSSLLSLIVGTVVGLVQHRIKRLLAYSTISHTGFLLLALAINSIESIQAFLFYIMQYTLSNINVFFTAVAVGYYLLANNKNDEKLFDKKNSPLQLISQLQGFFFVNPVLSLSLAITLFSFVGLPPLIGFFAKQQVLSAALNEGYYFLVLVGILTSVVSAVYYLLVIKGIFFDKPVVAGNNIAYSPSSSLSITISVLTLVILLFILSPGEWLSMANIFAQILFNT